LRPSFLLLALAAVILFIGAIRLGDLPGYDDALYSTEAKNIIQTGDWLNPSIRGAPALEHPPLLVWVQVLFFSLFGLSDMAAKAPAALSAVGTVLLVYWLARRLLRDSLAASVAMFVMLATPYFIKYANHAMTDVPTAFLFLCAMCAWSLTDRDPRWCLAAGLFTGLALMTRGLIGFALPVAFAIDMKAARRSLPARYLAAGLVIAILPLTAWYAHSLLSHPDFAATHSTFLETTVYGSLNPPWRRYTGTFEYAFMLLKSYWPWLPACVAGSVLIIRGRRRDLYLLLIWAAVVFLLCAAARGRVLRYMLPAYPAFSILSAVAIAQFIPRRFLDRAMKWVPAASVLAAIGIVAIVTPSRHAVEILPIAHAAGEPRGQKVLLYDQGQPRFDEANQLEWYGNCVPQMLLTAADLNRALKTPGELSALIIDRTTYQNAVKQIPHNVIAESGHLIYLRLR
jgi:4-amino-4-deoxy-L-arabinose transferase-like glycosyltransferase